MPGNVRVLSDKANRLKGNRDLCALERQALSGSAELRDDYRKVADYVAREALLVEVRAKAASGCRHAGEWAKVADFLDRAFRRGDGA